jgi:uncharacterized protein with GYD domain
LLDLFCDWWHNIKQIQIRRDAMLFITLLSPKGKGKEAVNYLKKLKAPKGIKIHGVYFTMGRYDGIILFEAPDAKKAINFAADVGFTTDYLAETLTAIPAREF